MIGYTRIAVGSGALEGCALCGGHQPRPPRYRSVDTVEDALARARDLYPANGILLSGPEPYNHPSLPELIARAAAQTGRVGIATSAETLTFGDNARGSITAGVRLIVVSLVGGDAPSHDRATARQGAFDLVRAGVARFREAARTVGARVAVHGVVRVCSHTVSRLPEIVGTFASWGASSVHVDADGAAATPELQAFVRAACETGVVNGVWVSVSGVEPGALGSHALHVTNVLELSEVEQ